MERDLQRDGKYCNNCTQEPGTVCIDSLRGRLVFRPTGTPLGSKLREPYEVNQKVADCPNRFNS